jgi:hypothetical protein
MTFIETDDGYDNARFVRRISVALDGTRTTLWLDGDLPPVCLDGDRSGDILALCRPLLPAHAGFTLLSVWVDDDGRWADLPEEHPVLAWRMTTYGAEPVTLASTSARSRSPRAVVGAASGRSSKRPPRPRRPQSEAQPPQQAPRPPPRAQAAREGLRP